MIKELIIACVLLAGNVIVYAVGLTVASRFLLHLGFEKLDSLWRRVCLTILVAWWLIVLHSIGIAIWAVFYWLRACLPDAESALYFSIITYTTVGYGDVILPHEYRLLAGFEALNGILMCGLSTGFFFAVAGRYFGTPTGPRSSKP